MPSHLSADRPAAQPPEDGPVEALISQTRRLKSQVDAVRRDAHGDGTDPQGRWQRALYDLALHQLDDLDEHLAQLRDSSRPPAAELGGTVGPLLSRVGSAEWNLLTDKATWSAELYEILGRDPVAPALTLDELPSVVLDEDRPALTAMVTACLIDGKPIDGEFRVPRPGGRLGTVHMMGEPVLDAEGGTASMWAVLRDVSELRSRRRAVRETRDSLRRHREEEQTEHRVTVELREAVLPAWHGPPRLPRPGPRALDIAGHCLPSAASVPAGGDWYDALELPDGDTLLSVGDLTGHGVRAASGMAMLLGALRGMAMAGTEPGQLMYRLDQLLDATAQPALGGAVCCRYRPATRTLVWAQAGHPAPLLFRDGTGHVLNVPDGFLPGTPAKAAYGQAEITLEPADLLLLHSGELMPGQDGTTAVNRLLGLAGRFTAAGTAQDSVRAVVEEFGAGERQDDACVLIARVSPAPHGP